MTDDQASRQQSSGILTLGWREWVGLPEFGIARIKAKIDTGARTSALHAYSVERFAKAGAPWVRLRIHPRQRNTDYSVECETDIIDERYVTDSGGNREMRIIIATVVDVGGEQWPIEMSVTDRDLMRFRMLLGRTAMRGRVLVDSATSYRLGKRRKLRPASRRVVSG